MAHHAVVTDHKTMERMETKDLWENYLLATAKVKELGDHTQGAQRFQLYLYRLVSVRSLELYFQRVEGELW
jgi:hypothetical protein